MNDAANRLDFFRTRSNLLREIREFFYAKNFLEVQTPILSRDTMVDRTIDPLSVPIEGFNQNFYLQTSPEFAMKRLLLQGINPIFEITSAFRNAEHGMKHNPEFTMLEWYRIGDDYEQGRALLAELACRMIPEKSLEQVSYKDLFQTKLGINPHATDVKTLASACQHHRVEIPDSSADKDFLLQLLMTEVIEPSFTGDTMFLVFDWPESQSALAKLRTVQEDGMEFNVSERFELYVDSLEIANGYHELCDPQEQLDRLAENNRFRESTGQSSLPVNSFLIREMQEKPLPDCCGVALGLDRLLMVRNSAESISEVISFPIEIA